MEMDPNTDIAIDRPDISKLTDVKTVFNTNDVIKTAYTINPDIRLAELQEQGYQQTIKVAKGSYYPVVSLFGGVKSNYSSINQKVIGITTLSEQIGTVTVGGTSTPVIGTVPVAGILTLIRAILCALSISRHRSSIGFVCAESSGFLWV